MILITVVTCVCIPDIAFTFELSNKVAKDNVGETLEYEDLNTELSSGNLCLACSYYTIMETLSLSY